jgi:prephenate dehydrogenase
VKLGFAGLGLIGGSMALALRDRHEVVGYDVVQAVRATAGARGIRPVERLDELLPADAVIVATPLAAVVPTLAELAPRAGDSVLIEVGSLKAAVAAYAERAPERARIVGLHPMAGSTASGFDAADASMFHGRPFLVVPTARSDDRAMAVAGDLARDLGGSAMVCSAAVHDRAVAAVSALPLAVAVALARVARAALPMEVDAVAGPGLRDATRLAATPAELALPLLGAPGLREHLASLRAALADVEDALGDEDALRALLDR